MSEYQYYEFLAVDRALNERQLAELRALSTRARITPTSFVNTYQWGNFRGQPSRMMEAYFDAFLYFANWNARELMIKLPARLLSIEAVTTYCSGESASAWVAGEHLIIDFVCESEEGGYDEDGEGWLASIIPIRGDLAAGDLRALYLGWLLSVQAGGLADDEVEPPVPANLTRLTASLRSLVDFLCIDEDLLAVAAAGSEESQVERLSDDDLARCIEDLPVAEKNMLLQRMIRGDGAHLRAELMRRLRPESNGPTATGARRRTVAELLAATDARRQERARQAAERIARERADRERSSAIAREKRLDALALREDEAWQRVQMLIEARKPAEYDEAVRLLKDLKEVGGRRGRSEAFDQRVLQLRALHSKKVSLIQRLDRLGV
jgi:hypothetical protein